MADKSTGTEGYTLSTRNFVMYSELNSHGRLFGGRLLRWIDEAAGMAATGIMQSTRVVTKKISEVVFDAPGMLGDLVEIWCKPVKEGRTSLTLDCKIIVVRPPADRIAICHCNIVYVNLDEAGRPTPWKGA